MKLGAFSISLAVKNLQTSKAFYETLGFEKVGGDESQGWLIVRNQGTTIGLFQGMFEQNILTFNPGWDANGENLSEFTDIRDLQKNLKERGFELETQADESTSGPASFTAIDPDGNSILVDQHR